MARNEEKQQGRLNRLWLQKERDEGRLKGVNERRPKLSTLNSASSVKKWLPSINKEIEYYLQQSQLSHYPERKIAEFQQQIEALEKEYKRFIAKLRVLDPSCKHKLWTPRAYCKRRADPQDSLSDGKSPRLSDSQDDSVQTTGSGRDFDGSESGVSRPTTTEKSLALPDARCQTRPPAELVSEPPEAVFAAQDQPLSFDRTRLAVAAAAFRFPPGHLSSSQTQNLAKLLQSGLPNLNNAQAAQTTASRDTADSGAADERPAVGRDASGKTEGHGGHVLGLDGYSSSDDDGDT